MTDMFGIRYIALSGLGRFGGFMSDKAAPYLVIVRPFRAHHETFQEEYVSFLKKYNVEYDERYVLGIDISPFQGLGFVALYSIRLSPYLMIVRPFRAWTSKNNR